MVEDRGVWGERRRKEGGKPTSAVPSVHCTATVKREYRQKPPECPCKQFLKVGSINSYLGTGNAAEREIQPYRAMPILPMPQNQPTPTNQNAPRSP